MSKFIFIWMISLCTVLESRAQTPLGYPEYLDLMARKNLEYAAEKFNVSIADANIEAAKVFPDPELSLGASDNGQRRMRMGYGFSTQISWQLELGGKRKARVQLAQDQSALTRALLENYFRNLRADGTLAFLNSLKLKAVLDAQTSACNNMEAIATADSIRFRLGSIPEIDARQSRLEARTMLNDVYHREAEWKTSLVQLGLLTGQVSTDTLYAPQGDFSRFDRAFHPDELTTAALNNRADLVAALKNKAVATQALRLARANRVTDLGLNLGAGNTSVVSNVVAPTPSFTVVSAGIAIPLKFSNKYKGELKAAEFGLQQADVLYQQTMLQIQGEVMQAWYNYLAARKQVQQFNTGLMADAQRVLDGRIYSYKRGETTLLEVLNAQRTYNDIQQDYYETLYSYAASLVELERAAGIWDINF